MIEPRGIQFPFRFNYLGSVAQVEGVEKVKSNMIALIKTALNERVIRKLVGSIGYRYILRNADKAAFSIIKTLVREAITKQEKRALLLDVRVYAVEAENGMNTYIDIDFIYKATGERDQLIVRLK